MFKLLLNLSFTRFSHSSLRLQPFSFLLSCSNLASVVASFYLGSQRLAHGNDHGEDVYSHAKDKNGSTAATHGHFCLRQQYEFAERYQMVLQEQKTNLVEQLQSLCTNTLKRLTETYYQGQGDHRAQKKQSKCHPALPKSEESYSRESNSSEQEPLWNLE